MKRRIFLEIFSSISFLRLSTLFHQRGLVYSSYSLDGKHRFIVHKNSNKLYIVSFKSHYVWKYFNLLFFNYLIDRNTIFDFQDFRIKQMFFDTDIDLHSIVFKSYDDNIRVHFDTSKQEEIFESVISTGKMENIERIELDSTDTQALKHKTSNRLSDIN